MNNLVNYFVKDKQKTIGKLIPTTFLASVLFFICCVIKRFAFKELMTIFSWGLGICILAMISALAIIVYCDAKEVQEKRNAMLLEEHNKRYPKE